MLKFQALYLHLTKLLNEVGCTEKYRASLLALPSSFCGTYKINNFYIIIIVIICCSYTRTSFVGQLSVKVMLFTVHCSNEICCQKHVVKFINNR